MLRCQIDTHSDKSIMGVCLDENCKGKRPICFRCSEEIHKTHRDKKDFQDLQKWIIEQNSLYQEIKQCIQSLQGQINELFVKNLRFLDDCQPPINVEELNNFTFNRLDQKINNIIALRNLKSIISQTLKSDEIQRTLNSLYTLSVQISQILNLDEKKQKKDQAIRISEIHEQNSPLTQTIIPEQKNDKEYYFEQGIELLIERKFKEAIQEFDSALSMGGEYILAKKWKAFALLQIGQDAQAAQICKEVFTSDKQQIRPYLICGQALYTIDLKQALHSIRKALQISSNNKQALAMQGKILFAQRQFEESIQSYEKCLRVDDMFQDALEGIIYPLIQLKQINQAKTFYLKLQQKYPYHKQLKTLYNDLEKYSN